MKSSLRPEHFPLRSFSWTQPVTAAAKSLQLCLTLCDPVDSSQTGSPIPGILQAKTLEGVVISFSSAWKWKVKVKLLSRIWLFGTPGTVAYQAPPSMGYSRQGYWSGMPLPSPIHKLRMLKLPEVRRGAQNRFSLRAVRRNQPWLRISRLPICETVNFCCLSHSAYRTLLWKPKGTHTYGKVKTAAFPQGKGSHWRVFCGSSHGHSPI